MGQTDKQKKKQHLSIILRILVAAGVLWLAFGGEDLGELSKVLLGLNPWLFSAAVGLFLLAQVLFVIRWRLLLRVLSIHIGLGVGLKLHLLGWFYNNCLPSSVGGDLLRAWYITKHVDSDKRAEAALSVFFDRAVGLTGMILMASFFYWLVPVEGSAGQAGSAADTGGSIVRSLAEYKWIFIWAAIAILAVFSAISAINKGRALLIKVWHRFWDIIVRIWVKGSAAVLLYSKSPITIISAIGLTFILQGISIIGFWLLGRDMGIGVHIKYYFVFFPVSWLVGTLPISIGGLGVIEGSIKLMFAKIGVIGEYASAIAICQRLVWWVVSVPGVVIHLAGAHLPKEKREFFVDGSEDLD